MQKTSALIIFYLSCLEIGFTQTNPTDSTFAVNGSNIINVESSNWSKVSIGHQSDDKIVVSASAEVMTNSYDFGVFRFTENGLPDSTFGNNGEVLIDLGTSEDMAMDICVQNDDKILVAGTKGNFADRDFIIMRLNSNGSIDSQFGNNGIVTLNVLYDDIFYCITIQPDGKILAAGRAEDKGYIYRLNTNGSLDNGFGAGGKISFSYGSSTVVKDILVNGSNKIIAAGEMAGSSSANAFIVSLNNDGSFNVNFGFGGKYLLNSANQEYLNTIALQKDNKILAGGSFGYSGSSFLAYFMVLRLLPDGSPDLTFNNSGTVLLSHMQNAVNTCNTIETDSSGNIFAGGYTGNINNTLNSIYIAKLKADGSSDSTFGINGQFTTSLYSNFEGATGSFMTSDERMVISGYSGNTIHPVLSRFKTSVTTSIYNLTYEKLSAFPNPCSEIIEVCVADYNGDIKLEIVDLRGQVLYTGHISTYAGKYLRINTAPFPRGVYIIKLSTPSKIGVTKFIRI